MTLKKALAVIKRAHQEWHAKVKLIAIFKWPINWFVKLVRKGK